MVIYNFKYKNKGEEDTQKLPSPLEIQEACANNGGMERDDLSFYVYFLSEKCLRFDLAYDGEPGQEKIVQECAQNFLNSLDLATYKFYEMKEINLDIFYSDLQLARKLEYIESERSVKRHLGLPVNDPYFKEIAIKSHSKTKEEILEQVHNLPSEDYLKDEIERIYTPVVAPNKFGVPAHYIVNCSDKQGCQEVLDVLTKSLVSNKRCLRNKYAVINLDDAISPFDAPNKVESDMQAAYCLNEYGLVALMCSYEIREDDRYSQEYDIIKRAAKCISYYSTNTTTVLCLISASAGVKKVFKQFLPDMLFITISDDELSGEKAQKYLEKLAENKKVQLPANFNDINYEQSYKPKEIKKIFDNWYAKYIKICAFPQYLEYVEEKEETNEDNKHAFDDLEKLVGLKEIKKVVKDYINYSKLQRACEKLGKPAGNYCRHMLFTGNPGTAKTTVARIIAQIMKENGLLSRGNLIEVGRSDLVSKFVGGTAPKVKDVFQSAKGNVLFIDEAYSLCEGKEGLYGDEAINTIVQEMENNREDMVVIFAGYKKEMQEFINRNSGLKSRVAYEVDFPDYSIDELMQIAHLQAQKMGVDISLCEPVLRDILKAGKESLNFGNGRFVRKVLERARMKQASRIVEQNLLNEEQIGLLQAEDFESPTLSQNKAKMGFQI